MVPIILVLARRAASTFFRCSGDIRLSRYFVSEAVCQSTPVGSSSTMENNPRAGSLGLGSRHQIQLSSRSRGRRSLAVRRDLGCQGFAGAAEINVLGGSVSADMPMTNRRGRDCGTNLTASITRHPIL